MLGLNGLTVKALITTAADNNVIFFIFQKKIRFVISCESFARQKIHMKCQLSLIFSEKIIVIIKKNSEFVRHPPQFGLALEGLTI